MNLSPMTRRGRNVVLSMLLALTGITPTAFAQQNAAGLVLPAGMTAGPSAEGISEYRLANGLKVLLFPDKSKELTLVNVTYLVGSKHENYGETGMAHLLEHLVFKGTPKFADMTKDFTARGMRWNGTTSVDRTNYFETFSANPDHLRFALELEADRMVNSFIAKKDLDSEMTVVRNEFERLDSTPGAVLQQRLSAAAFTTHNYGKPLWGAKSDIENVNIERLQAFYKRYYQPDNAVLLVAGKFEPEQTLKWIAEFFAPIPKPERVLPKLYTVEPTQDGDREVNVRRVGDVKLLFAGYKTPGRSHPDAIALQVAAGVLTRDPIGPMFKAFVETKKAAQAFQIGGGGVDMQLSGFGLRVDKTQDLAALEREFIDLIEGRTAVTLLEEDVERARREMTVNFEKVMESPIGVAMLLSELVATGDWRSFFAIRDSFANVTLADVERVRRTYFKPANRTIARYLPEDKPDRVEVAAPPDIASVVATYKPRALVADGEAFVATPETLEARATRKMSDAKFQIATLRKQNRGNSVVLMIDMRWGELADQTKQPALGLASVLLSEGPSAKEKQARIDALTKLKSHASFSSGLQRGGITLHSDTEHIIEAVKLILPQVRAATLDADAFERIKKQRITSLEANAREPQTLINNLAIPYKNKAFGVARGEIHHRLTNAEQIAELRALSFEDVRKAYEQNWGATAVRVSVVGTAPDGLLEEVNKQLVGWTSKAKPYVRYVGKHQPVAGTTLTVEAPDKSNAVIDVDQFLPLNRNHPDSQALGLAVEIFGAGQSDNRLIARIRKKDGLSYHIGAHVSIPEFGDRAYLGIEGTYAPQNRDKVLAALREETELALKDGFTQAELDRARANVLQGRAQGRNNDDAIARALLSQMDTNETFADSAKRDAELKTITLDQVNAAFRKYIKPDEWLIGVAGDFAKAASQTAPK